MPDVAEKVRLAKDINEMTDAQWKAFAEQFLPGGVKRRLADHIIELRKQIKASSKK